MNTEVKSFNIDRYWAEEKKGCVGIEDLVSVEEPLQLMLYHQGEAKYKDFTITMRTPSQDKALCVGFLFNENIIKNIREVEEIHEGVGQVKICLSPSVNLDKIMKSRRHFVVSSSCGVCGELHLNNSRLDNIQCRYEGEFNRPKRLCLQKSIVFQLAKKNYSQQFIETGGLHTSTLLNTNGEVIDVKEDVGRHNALDKIIGQALIDDRLPLTNCILLLSGRVSYELVQKAAMAGIRCICALGAPSSLAVETAVDFDITLIGFITYNKFNVYHLSKDIEVVD